MGDDTTAVTRLLQRWQEGERDALVSRCLWPCVVHQDMAHQVSRHAEEMGAIFPGLILLPDQLEEGFVQQPVGAQGVFDVSPGRFPPQKQPDISSPS